ncbi:protein MCM10 homolog [Xenia sp. Carnegie-2017]|uniref:protein MCM10 homolog n=1 Tax=Xenia sp. Carnegie-2017 TaxID=2897299 RepID=UPI001F04D698|nr:protein MCM10 homolog [Xenia sp. Carnegie-2017]
MEDNELEELVNVMCEDSDDEFIDEHLVNGKDRLGVPNEDDELHQLAKLMDEDSDEEFIDQLPDMAEYEKFIIEKGADEKHDENVPVALPTENISRKMSEMEKYIKFLEEQLKSKNQEINNSPKNKVDSENPRDLRKLNAPETSGCNHSENKTVKEKFFEKKDTERAPSISDSSLDMSLTRKPRVAHAAARLKTSGTKRKADDAACNPSLAKKPSPDDNGVTDGYSGLRILNPLISSTVMKRRTEGRKIIKISSIQSKIVNNDIEGDWITIGVVIQKFPKTTSKGETYSVWKLSDLAFHLQTSIIVLFLFGENHKQHWKTAEGSVVALLNPSLLPSREKKSSDVALTLDNPKKIMLLGISQDFGVCKSSRKSDGKRCSNFINKSQGDYCQYHVQREYKKRRSHRMECQQGYGAPSTLPGSKTKKKVAGESYLYGDRIVSTNATGRSLKEKVTLKSLNASSEGKDYLFSWKKRQNLIKAAAGKSSAENEDKGGPSSEFLNLLNVPSIGSRNLKLHLHKEDEQEKEANEPRRSMSVSQFLKANNTRSRTTNSTSDLSSDKKSVTMPVLGRGLTSNGDLVFDENIPLSIFPKVSNDPDRAKERARSLIRRIGPIAANNPNDIKVKKPSPKLQTIINRKLDSELTGGDQSVPKCGGKFSLADGFSLNSNEGRRILNAKSKHAGEVRLADVRREQDYFNHRERKEEMETKMLLTQEIKVKAVHCAQCKYMAEKPASKCNEEKHVLTSVQVFKKFFACKDCKQRTVTYGQRYPTRDCRQCGGKNWEKCGMWKERNGPKIGRDTLMLRGPEYAKFLNSLATPQTNGVVPKYI